MENRNFAGDLQISKVNKWYPGDVHAVKDMDMEIKRGEFIVFVGPSGCGKTTLLRMIAGLESISSGEVIMDGRTVNQVPPKNRDIAMVFQNYALYPNMKVKDNIAFPLKMQHIGKTEREKRVAEVAQKLELDALLERKPGALSGGQRQRVALARAMIRNPGLFLMDEPLANLDAKLRTEMRREIIIPLHMYRQSYTPQQFRFHDAYHECFAHFFRSDERSHYQETLSSSLLSTTQLSVPASSKLLPSL